MTMEVGWIASREGSLAGARGRTTLECRDATLCAGSAA
jgi:hypothetical protein